MNIDNFMPNRYSSGERSLTAPRRELELDKKDVPIIKDALEQLDRSDLKTQDLYEVFADWQTKKTLTSKRVFFSTSILTAAAAWIGIDYSELSFFGLKVTNGSPERFIVFLLLSICVSGVFYELSKRIDSAVRAARVKDINGDLQSLIKPTESIDETMKRNNIDDFADLYFDFRSALDSTRRDAIEVYRAVKFYKENLSKAGIGLSFVTVAENLIVYSIAATATLSLIIELAQ